MAECVSTTVHVPFMPLGARSYDIHIGPDALDRLGAYLASDHAPKGLVGLVTDAHVAPLYADAVLDRVRAAGKACVVHTLPAGEESKRLDRVGEICGAFLEAGMDRAGLVVALGGGVTGDIAGFAASVFMRGVPFVQIPTTIVAQVDSSVGGKTGVNHPLGKNTIGAFHQPDGVFIDLAMLSTLPDRELRAGMAEVIKHGVIADADLFAYLEENAARILAKDLDALRVPVVRSCEIKAAVVAADEREQGLRANLNYGHTFGHAIETASGYARFLHGEAVALGMCAAGELGRLLGLVDAAFAERQRACCAAFGLPVRWPEMPLEETLAAMKHDKKARAGTLKFIVPAGMGMVVHRTDIPPELARAALETLL
ncbi:MAG TPA: 3-dehydroquinate synthase [Candidatus Hydrogenedentes bacterium]|nr:3-dehydroquinate synthase [Candidatus Hydrogenedentota bacterium]HOC71299.1 3-dehydroquinate synthase [Candidatus Hydrogenedentota bacterium]HOH49093.1 3-dehydroquinate synthase [Candidatus Hydrogenedentota bacterium]HQL93316.1 3-dehydroquinate synthase [Candidatus Hydrogenedentota bacterium]